MKGAKTSMKGMSGLGSGLRQFIGPGYGPVEDEAGNDLHQDDAEQG